ncbi:prepilin-type N-terminal cleavage/methylation domain-containing protein [bacterium]|nr:prepilin-type N-terminal cleavage/methylation domain-containing protein [bacterium]
MKKHAFTLVEVLLVLVIF